MEAEPRDAAVVTTGVPGVDRRTGEALGEGLPAEAVPAGLPRVAAVGRSTAAAVRAAGVVPVVAVVAVVAPTDDGALRLAAHSVTGMRTLARVGLGPANPDGPGPAASVARVTAAASAAA
jgi:uroporphyrinogen-III synthase